MTLDGMAPPIWGAAPPEVHSTLLSAGATAASMTAAGLSWTQLGAQYIAALAELEGIIATIQATYSGPSAEQFIMAHQPMLLWLADVAAKSEFAAASHAEIVAAYEGAVVAMPTLGELFENHFVHGVLIGTNFFGVNTIPIGMNELDYHRMWELAADVMSGWDAASTASATAIPPTPMSPLTLMLGVGESGSTSASAAAAGNMAGAMAGGVSLQAADLGADGLLGQKAGAVPAGDAANAASQSNQVQNASNKTDSAANPQNAGLDLVQQFASMGPEAASGPAQTLSSAPQQLASAPPTTEQPAGQHDRQLRRQRHPSNANRLLRDQRHPRLQPSRADQHGRRRVRQRPVRADDAVDMERPAGQRNDQPAPPEPSHRSLPAWAGPVLLAAAPAAARWAPAHTAAAQRGGKKVHAYTDDAVDDDEDVDADSDGGAYVMSR